MNAPLLGMIAGRQFLLDEDFTDCTVAHADDVDAFLWSADALAVGTEAGDFPDIVSGSTLYAGGGSYTDGKRSFGQLAV